MCVSIQPSNSFQPFTTRLHTSPRGIHKYTQKESSYCCTPASYNQRIIPAQLWRLILEEILFSDEWVFCPPDIGSKLIFLFWQRKDYSQQCVTNNICFPRSQSEGNCKILARTNIWVSLMRRLFSLIAPEINLIALLLFVGLGNKWAWLCLSKRFISLFSPREIIANV